MRYSLFCLALLSGLAMAEPVPADFSQAKFEKRFHAADKDGNGMLSREEAYAEFPRMPEFFDEIDTNKDGRITLIEVNQAMARRVKAAMDAGRAGGKYVRPADLAIEQPQAPGEADDDSVLFGKTDAGHQQRSQYYESLAEGQGRARNLGEPVPAASSPNLLNRSY